MIEYKSGDLLEADVEAIVNAVNCVGVMGKGIALQFKEKYPANFRAYAQACRSKQVRPGKMFVYPLTNLYNPKWIINFPTKQHWKQPSKLEDIALGLQDLRQTIITLDIKSIALPTLGCGLGGLSWPKVNAHVRHYLNLRGVRVIIMSRSPT